jgi:hypothetical protein
MSAGQMSPGSDGFQFPDGKKLVTVGGGAVAANEVRRHLEKSRHDRLVREQNRSEGLNKGSINPHQYVLYCARDDVPADHIREGLVAWGRIDNGHDYSIPESFELEDIAITSANPLKRRFNMKDRSCHLHLYPPNKGETAEGPQNRFRRRGGYTGPMEPQIMLENGAEMTTHEHQYRPNWSCEISEEYLEGRPVVHTFTAARPDTIPPVLFYVVGIGLALAGSLLFDYVQRKFSRWTGSKGSQQLASTVKESNSVEGVKRPSSITLMTGEGQGL